MSEKCQRCGKEGEDRRTIWMACHYEMSELGIPLEERMLSGALMEPVGLREYLPGVKQMEFSETERSANAKFRFYTIRVCKNCRADWLQAIKTWHLGMRWDHYVLDPSTKEETHVPETAKKITVLPACPDCGSSGAHFCVGAYPACGARGLHACKEEIPRYAQARLTEARDFSTVCERVLFLIPSWSKWPALAQRLHELCRESRYATPEDQRRFWVELARVLEASLPKEPDQAWQFEIGKVVRGEI